MTAAYKWVQWNAHKRTYDLIMAGAIVAYLAVFVIITTALNPAPNDISPPIILMRATATLAIILLHIILAIGPIARLTDRAAPLLYNRRHLGVAFFLVAALHALIALAFYGGFGVRNPASALIDGGVSFASISAFPFELLGLIALIFFFVMAATSHDFWLANLSPRTWKSLHMLAYPAYGLVLLHVALGPLQSEPSPIYPALLIAGATTIGALHITAALYGGPARRAGSPQVVDDDNWIDAASVDDIPLNQAKLICVGAPARRAGSPLPATEQRIAVFRHDKGFSAVSNTCAHQGGPLAEGRVINGCITCPWHGYQYRPEDATSPPPYTEKLPTYDIRIEGKRILINPTPNPPGTKVDPAPFPKDATP